MPEWAAPLALYLLLGLAAFAGGALLLWRPLIRIYYREYFREQRRHLRAMIEGGQGGNETED